MADQPTGTGPSQPGPAGGRDGRGDDLDRRRRDLDAALTARKPPPSRNEDRPRTGGMAGLGYALRLSSEFVAAIIVGGVIGWVVDYGFGISPWGLVVFLLLGFLAGVLNVLRAAGKVAEFGQKTPKG